jgi:hypothetical protein
MLLKVGTMLDLGGNQHESPSFVMLCSDLYLSHKQTVKTWRSTLESERLTMELWRLPWCQRGSQWSRGGSPGALEDQYGSPVLLICITLARSRILIRVKVKIENEVWQS